MSLFVANHKHKTNHTFRLAIVTERVVCGRHIVVNQVRALLGSLHTTSSLHKKRHVKPLLIFVAKNATIPSRMNRHCPLSCCPTRVGFMFLEEASLMFEKNQFSTRPNLAANES